MVTYYELKATWRAPPNMRDGRPLPVETWGRDIANAPIVTLVSGMTLDDPIADVMRFALLGSGLFVLGDALTVMHQDIGLAAMEIEGNHGDALMIGLLERTADGWVARTQPHSTAPTVLFPRLTTWKELVGNNEVIINDDYGTGEFP